jgi:hypothetical protein
MSFKAGSPAGARLYPTLKTNLSGEAAKRNFWPWGSAQVLEKARFGEMNPRIFLGSIWPDFAGFGPGFAGFGFG